jgi:hypothetical protein
LPFVHFICVWIILVVRIVASLVLLSWFLISLPLFLCFIFLSLLILWRGCHLQMNLLLILCFLLVFLYFRIIVFWSLQRNWLFDLSFHLISALMFLIFVIFPINNITVSLMLVCVSPYLSLFVYYAFDWLYMLIDWLYL